jgi:small subunit ribosomal protein S21
MFSPLAATRKAKTRCVSILIEPKLVKGGHVVKLTVRDRESIQEAVRRFRKLVERSGIKKEMRRREYYEKPSEIRRRARLRAERRTRRTKVGGVAG